MICAVSIIRIPSREEEEEEKKSEDKKVTRKCTQKMIVVQVGGWIFMHSFFVDFEQFFIFY
jgi:hypothetical protein